MHGVCMKGVRVYVHVCVCKVVHTWMEGNQLVASFSSPFTWMLEITFTSPGWVTHSLTG